MERGDETTICAATGLSVYASGDVESASGNMESPPVKRPRPNQRLCPHCSQIVSYKTYRSHRRLHYNCDDDSWFSVASAETLDEQSEETDLLESESPASSPTFDEDTLTCTEESPPHSDYHLILMMVPTYCLSQVSERSTVQTV